MRFDEDNDVVADIDICPAVFCFYGALSALLSAMTTVLPTFANGR